MDSISSSCKIHNLLANLDSTTKRRKEKHIYIIQNRKTPYIYLNTCVKRTVKTRSCPRQTQMPLIVLLLSSPNIQALANAPFLIESNRWYIPLIKLQDMKTYVNKKHVNDNIKQQIFDQLEKYQPTLVNSLLYLYSPSQML